MEASRGPDAAAAILNTDRARTATLQARQYRAQAEAVMEAEDPDDLAGDVRRTVYRNLLACADTYEALADAYRERAFSAQQARPNKYDESFAALHATGKCRSRLCCGGTATA